MAATWKATAFAALITAGASAPDGKCDIPYHDGPIPAAAAVKSWKVVENYGAIWVWFDPEGGEPDYDLPTFGDWTDETFVNGEWDYLGELASTPWKWWTTLPTTVT